MSSEKILSCQKEFLKTQKNDSRENNYLNSHGFGWWIGGRWLISVMIDRWVIKEAKEREKREMNVKKMG